MASDRNAAKSAIESKSNQDAELDEVLSGAHTLQIKLAQENNRHAEAMRKADIGLLGRALGGEKSAPTYIAFIVAVTGLVGTGYCWYRAGASEIANDFWSAQAERALAFSASAIAYIFGRGNK